MRACPLVAVAAVVAFGAASTALAGTCPVPSGSHPTIQSAVDDVGCTEIGLGGQTYTESVAIGRTLLLTGVSPATSIIAGRVVISGAAADVTVAELTVDGSHPAVAGCFVEAVEVEGCAQMVGSNIVVVNSDGIACLVFGDGFEDGTTGAWSATTP